MKKNVLIGLAAATLLSVGAGTISVNSNTNEASVVQAATKTKKLTHNAYIYNSKGKRVKGVKKLKKGKSVKILSYKTINGAKYARIGKNKYIKLSNTTKSNRKSSVYKKFVQPQVATRLSVDVTDTKHPKWPSGKSLVTNANKLPAGTKYSLDTTSKDNFNIDYTMTPFYGYRTYSTLSITEPGHKMMSFPIEVNYDTTKPIKFKLVKGFNLDFINKTASQGKLSEEEQDLLSDAIDANHFVSESPAEDNEVVNVNKLTQAQRNELSKYTAKLYSQIRKQLGLNEVSWSPTMQYLVETEDQTTDLGLSGGYTFNFASEPAGAPAPRTMTELKKVIYDGMLNALFSLDNRSLAPVLIQPDVQQVAVTFQKIKNVVLVDYQYGIYSPLDDDE